MKRLNKSIALSAIAASTFSVSGLAQALYDTPGATYSQNFDSLATSGTANTWANNSTIAGWSLFRRTSASDATPTAITAYRAGDGSVNTGAFYSFGTGTSTDRALGGIASSNATAWGSPATGAVAGWIAVGFQNTTGAALNSFTLGYTGEQWRDGGSATPAAQTMTLEYGFGSSFSAVTTWTAPGASFNFTSPVFTAPAAGAAVNGNVAGQVTGLGGTVSSVTWNNSDTLFIRWIENNDQGNDHGLAIDNFTFSAAAVPEPSEYAAMAGAGLVGFAIWRRRMAHKA